MSCVGVRICDIAVCNNMTRGTLDNIIRRSRNALTVRKKKNGTYTKVEWAWNASVPEICIVEPFWCTFCNTRTVPTSYSCIIKWIDWKKMRTQIPDCKATSLFENRTYRRWIYLHISCEPGVMSFESNNNAEEFSMQIVIFFGPSHTKSASSVAASREIFPMKYNCPNVHTCASDCKRMGWIYSIRMHTAVLNSWLLESEHVSVYYWFSYYTLMYRKHGSLASFVLQEENYGPHRVQSIATYLLNK